MNNLVPSQILHHTTRLGCRVLWCERHRFNLPRLLLFRLCLNMIILAIIITTVIAALAQIPISTFSHIWVFVRQYGVMFVIIVIIIIIIIIYRKVKVSTLKHV